MSFIFLIISFLNLIIYFYSVTLICIFSPSHLHICGPYIGSTQSASVGTLTPQKNANATNQRFSSSVESVVKYHHTTTSIPNIFKSTSLLHFVKLFSTVLESERGQGCSRRDSCVCFEKVPTHIWCCPYIYINSLTQTYPKPHSMFLVLADGLKIEKFWWL